MSGNRKLLILLSGAFVLDHMDRHILSITLDQIGQEFSLNDLALGALSGLAFAVFFGVLGVPLAKLARPGQRRLLAAGTLAAWSALTALTAASGSYLHLLLARMGVAISEAGFTPAAHSMIADSYPEGRRAGAFAFFSAGANIGLFLAFLVGGVVASAYGWRAAFLVAGLPGLVIAFVIWVRLVEPLPAAPGRQVPAAAGPGIAGVWRRMMRQPSTRLVLLGAVLTATVNYGGIAWVAAFLIRRYGLEVDHVGIYLAAVAGLLGGTATFACGMAADRLGARNPAWRIGLVALTLAAAKLLAIAAYLQPSALPALALLAFPAMMGGIYLGPTFGHVYSRVPDAERPQASAIILLLLNLIGIGLGPLLVGAISTALQSGTTDDRALMFALTALQGLGLLGAVAFFGATRCRDLRQADRQDRNAGA